jgi:DNA polymerase-3 subunit alpha
VATSTARSTSSTPCRRRRIKPILGCELYVPKNEDHHAPFNDDKYNHLVVLTKNEAGYSNLVRLTSEVALRGLYRKPRVSKAFLSRA